MGKLTFSGHESFVCKTHWLKRGYDFVLNNHNFNDEDSVVELGVGKNMVSSIRYWMKAFGLLDQDGNLTDFAKLLFDTERGFDPYLEDNGSLWLLHYLLVHNNYATIYYGTFVDFHAQRNIIDKKRLQNFVKHVYFDNTHYASSYNEKTIAKDINVFIRNYCENKSASIEERNTLLSPLNLLNELEDGSFAFNVNVQSKVPEEILLYAIIDSFPGDVSISFEALKDLMMIFCLSNNDMVGLIKRLCDKYPNQLVYSEVAGIKELQFRDQIITKEILTNYYQNR